MVETRNERDERILKSMSERDRQRYNFAQERYLTAAHAIQAGVATEMQMPDRASATEPKHLRTGININMVDNGSLVELLVRKGVITYVELMEALADGMEQEQHNYEARISAAWGKPVKLV